MSRSDEKFLRIEKKVGVSSGSEEMEDEQSRPETTNLSARDRLRRTVSQQSDARLSHRRSVLLDIVGCRSENVSEEGHCLEKRK